MTKFSDDTMIDKARNNEKKFVSYSKLDTDRMDCRKSEVYISKLKGTC